MWQVTGPSTLDADTTVANAGILTFDDSLFNDGNIDIAGGATLAFAGVVLGGGNIDFAGPGGTLAIGGTLMANTISGFDPGDTIELTGFSGDSATLGPDNLLTISGGGVTYALQFDLLQDFSGEVFSVADDGTGGTIVTVANSSGPPVVSSGGIFVISSGITESGITILAGGTLIVESGGTALNTLNSGSETVSAGGSDIGGTIANGGAQDLFGIASGTVILDGGSQTVEASGHAVGTVLSDPAVQTVFGSADGTVVSVGDFQIVGAGGVASATVVSSGGIQAVSAGGVANAAIISGGGTQNVFDGGLTNGTTILGGGVEELFSGAVAIGTVVSSGGSEVVTSGGTAIGIELDGGTLAVAEGAVISGTIIFDDIGGILQIDGTTMPTATISGIDPGDTIDLRSLAWSPTNSASYSDNTLTVTGGGTIETLTVVGVAAGTQFAVSSDGLGGTLVTAVFGGATASTEWTNSSGGDWTVAGNWSDGVPTSLVDATLGALPSFYTVTLTGNGAAESLTLESFYVALNISTASGGSSANLAIADDLSNAGTLRVDASGAGGSTVTVGGVLINTSYLYIGNAGLSAAATVSADALSNTGTIQLYGGTGTNTGQATLDIAASAPNVLTGNIYLFGHAVLQFGSGSFNAISATASLSLSGPNAFVASAASPNSNSALSLLASNAGTLTLDSGAVVAITGDLANNGTLRVDYSTGGGSVLAIGGVFSNTGTLYAGASNWAAPTTISAGALVNTGSIQLIGGAGTNTTQTTLDIGSAAAAVWRGGLYLYGHARIEFAGSSSIASIADGAYILLNGSSALVSNEIDPGSNSALAGLASNAGSLQLENGVALNIQGDFANDGSLLLDYGYGVGGSDLTIAGLLSNTGIFYIGNSNSAAGTTVSAADLFNAGTIYLYGGSGTNANQALLDITSGTAPSVLTGDFNLLGTARVAFAGNASIGTISYGGSVLLNGASALISNAADPTSNSALAELASNDGTINLSNGASLHIQGDLINNGYIYVDYSYYASADSSLTIDGRLSNIGFLGIGNSNGLAPTAVSVADLINTGSIYLYGGSGTSTYQATLEIAFGSAPSVLTGRFNLTGNALVAFAGGQITHIGDLGEIVLNGTNAFIANQSDFGSNSALSGLASNAGTFNLQDGATVHMSGNFANFGSISLGSYYTSGAGSTLTVDGKLTNTGSLTIGSAGQGAATTVVASDFASTGSVNLYGGTGAAPMLTTLRVTSGAAPTVLTGYFSVSGEAIAEFASGGIESIAYGAQLIIGGPRAFIANQSDPGSNSALTGLASNAGILSIGSGATLHTSVDFANFGTLYVDGYTYYGGGSTLTIDGTLSNTGTIYIGNSYISASTTVSVAALANGGFISLIGGIGTSTHQAILDITGSADVIGAGGTIYLYQNGVLNAASPTIANGGRIVVSSGGSIAGAPLIDGGTLELGGGTVTGGGIAFVGVGGRLQINNNTMPTNTISGFDQDDTIDLRGLAYNSANTVAFDAGTGTLTVSGGGVTDTLTLVGIATGAQFGLANDGVGFTAVFQLPFAAATIWSDPTGGDWTDPANWSSGVPGSTTDATIGVAGSYTVSLTASGAANSLIIDHAGVIFAISTASGSPTPANLAVQGDVTNSATLHIDALGAQGGSTVAVGGLLFNKSYLQIGNATLSAPTAVSAGEMHNTGTFLLAGGSAAAATLAIAGDVTNTFSLQVDSLGNSGGSTLAIGGTLTNTLSLQIGNTGLALASTVTASALANTGTIQLFGGTGANTAQATLDISGLAPSIWTGQLHLSGHALVEFESGSIERIANGAAIVINGADAFVADSSSPGSNSALSGLAENAGRLELTAGATVGIVGDLGNNGSLYVDRTGIGGSLLEIGGTLTNANGLYIGNGSATTQATVSAGALVNTGYIEINGGAGATVSTLAIGSAAPSVLTGSLYLTGNALVAFAGGGSISGIANGASVIINGGNAFIAVGGSLDSNSALAGLVENAGILDLRGGAAAAITGDFVNDGTIYVDFYSATGGGSLTIGGTLTNTRSMSFGNSSAALGTTISAAGLVNTGYISLYGGTGTNTSQAILDIAQAAPSLLTGTLNLYGNALVEFDGSDSIHSIAAGGGLLLSGANAHVANATDPNSNSALAGLTSNAGTLEIDNGAALNIQGDFNNDGTLYVDRIYYASAGGSSLTIDGTLGNANYISIGNSTSVAPATVVTAAYLANTGTIYLYGGAGTNTSQAILDVTSGTAPAVLTGHLNLYGHSRVRFAGGDSIVGIGGSGGIFLDGGDAFIANASDPDSNSALAGLASNAGDLGLTNGATLSTPGNFSNSGFFNLDYPSTYNGGSSATIGGTLYNTGVVNIGNTYQLLAGTTLRVAELDNTGTINLRGGLGTSTNQATLDITAGSAPSVLDSTFTLFGRSLVQFAGGASITAIANDGSLTLNGANAFIANASDPTSNSALSGLASNAGLFDLEQGAALSLPGDFANSGRLYVDAFSYYYGGGSSFSIGGTLTNTGYIQIGGNYQSASTIVSMSGLANGGTINIYGNFTTGTQTSLNIAGTATDSGSISLFGSAVLSAGSLTVTSGGSLYVYSGATASGAIVGSGGLEYVYSGGVTASGTISGGTLQLAGGTVSAATIEFVGRGGTLEIDTATMPTNTIVGFGGYQTIDLRVVSGGSTATGSIDASNVLTVTEQGGISYTLQLDPNRNYTSTSVILTSDAFGGTVVMLDIAPTFVSSGDTLIISAGQIEDNVNVLNGGTLIVLSGGTAVDTIEQGTEILSGGLDVTGLVESGGKLYVSAGGLASNTTVAQAGQMDVLSGGSAYDPTVTSGGFVAVQSGGLTSNSTIAGGTLALAEGAATSGTTAFVGSGGVLWIDGTTMPTNVISGFDGDDAIDIRSLAFSTSNSASLSGNTLTVTGGGVTETLTVIVPVSSGFETEFVVADDGFGGTLVRVIYTSSGGSSIVSAGETRTISSGQTSAGLTVLFEGTLIVLSGGTAVGAVDSGTEILRGGVDIGGTVGSGGVLVISAGGSASGTDVHNGGTAIVSAGGIAVGANIVGGIEVIFGGGVTFGTLVSDGVEMVASGGVASGTTVLAGGFEVVSAGGVTVAPVLVGSGLVQSGGTAIDPTISGTTLVLADGAIASGTISLTGVGDILQIDGTTMPVAVIDGFDIDDSIDLRGVTAGNAGSVTLGAGNLLTVHDGGVTYNLQLDPGDSFAGQTFDALDDGSGGTLIKVLDPHVVGSGQTLVLSAGQTVSNITVLAGGTLVVGSGAVSIGAQIDSGGTEIIGAGGLDINATVANGGYQDIFGTASGTLIITGGSQTVEVGGVAQQTLLDDAAIQDVFGFAGGTVISATDIQIVESGGVASGTTISSGGFEIVFSGGLTIDTTIDGGGALDLHDGAAASGTIHFAGAGGFLRIDGSTMPAVSITGFERGDRIDIRGLPADAGNTVTFDPLTGALTVSGGSIETLQLSGVAAGTAFGLVDDGSGGTIVVEVPPAPVGLTLSPESDSGVLGDNVTNNLSPVISGTGEVDNIVTLFDGGIAVGSGTVGGDGRWAVIPVALADGAHNLVATERDAFGGVSASSPALSLTIDTSPPLTLPVSREIVWNSGATPIGIAAPSDAADALTVTVEALPANGTVTLADGVTAVTLNLTLTIGELTGLAFTPGANQIGLNGSFGYRVVDPAGNQSVGSAALSVVPAESASLFDFVFTYTGSSDYYLGTVADDGTFGYQVGAPISVGLGQYNIFYNEGSTAQAAGTVVVTYYSHGGLGQLSSTPIGTAAGLPSGLGGLGSESDAVRGIDGQAHPFSSNLEPTFATNSLFGFVYSYADGAGFYSGTVADDGSFGVTSGSRAVIDPFGNVLGTYSVFGSGVTTRAPGTVVVDRVTFGSASFIPNRASPDAVDGVGGLGTESGTITVNGTTLFFSDDLEPVVTLSLPTAPVVPVPNPADVITAVLNQIYADVLGRAPDSGGLATYTEMLNTGTSAVTIRGIVAQSSEAADKINQLYDQVFARPADAGGLATYKDQLSTGSNLSAVRLILGQSPEAEFHLQEIYQEVLGRAGDGGGLVTYMGFLATGLSIGTVRDIVAHSPEARDDLNQLVLDVLLRGAFAAELVGMEDELSSGASQLDLQAELLLDGTAGIYTTMTDGIGSGSLTALPGVPTLFVFNDLTLGADTIVGFDPTRDTIRLPQALAGDVSTLLNATTEVAGGALISLNPAQSILISGLNPANLNAANFSIV